MLEYGGGWARWRIYGRCGLDLLGQLQRLHRGDEAGDQEQGGDRVADRAERNDRLEPFAEQQRRQAGRERAGGGAGRGQGRRSESAGEREGEELGAVAHFGGEDEDEGGGERPAGAAGLLVLARDQAGNAGEEQRQSGHQRHRPDRQHRRDPDAGDRGDDVAGEDGENEAGRHHRGAPRRRAHRGDDQLGLVAPGREQSGGEGGDERFH